MKVFVYGTLKRGFGNHRLLEAATYLGKAVTTKACKMSGYGVPFVWPAEGGLLIQGEVYDIGDVMVQPGATTLHRLDQLESNGRVYDRKPHIVRMIENAQGIKPLPRDQGEEHEAWMYEAMEHVVLSYELNDDFTAHMLRYVNAEGHLEWSRVPHWTPLDEVVQED
jgi:gamma-glutamylaminecyclotransferase